MRDIKRILFLLIFVNIAFCFFAETTDDAIVTNISKTEIKIGEKINLTIKIPHIKDVKVLWEDISYSDSSVDVISKKDFYKADCLNFDIDFTFFNPGYYDDFNFTIPISQKDGEMLYLVTDKFDITVKGELTSQEVENLKKIDDPSKIILRKEKDIVSIKFNFSPYIKIIIIVLLIIAAGLVTYFVLYRLIFKKKGDNKGVAKKLPPYENFLKNISMLCFDQNDARIITENKLSILTETLKELIYDEFSLNAPSETTRELIRSLRNLNFKEELIIEINNLFTEIDLIKFAKADYDYENLVSFLNKIKDLGSRINNYYKERNNSEEKNVNV